MYSRMLQNSVLKRWVFVATSMMLAVFVLSGCMKKGIYEDLDHEAVNEENAGLRRVLTIDLVSLALSEETYLGHKIKEFAAQNPDIEINLRWSNNLYSGLSSWIVGRDGVGAPPDIVELTPNQMNVWFYHGKLEPLSLHETELRPHIITSPDGYILGLKSKVNPLIVYYDKTVFDSLGLDPPAAHWSWSMLDGTIQALKEADYNIYIKMSPAILEWVSVNRFGGRIVDASGTVFSGYMDSKETVQAAKWLTWVGTKDEDYLPRKTHEGWIYYDPMPRDLIDGNMALAIDFAHGLLPSGTTSYERVAQRNENIGIAPLPGGANTVNIANTAGLAIPTEAENKDLAIQLLRFLAKDAEAYYEDIARYTLTAESSVKIQSEERLDVVVNEIRRSQPASLLMYEDQHHGDNRAYFPPYHAMEQGISAKDALRQYAEEIELQFMYFKEDLDNYATCIRNREGVCGW